MFKKLKGKKIKTLKRGWRSSSWKSWSNPKTLFNKLYWKSWKIYLKEKLLNYKKKKRKQLKKICNENNNIEKRDKDNNVEITTATSLENSKEY